MHSTNNLEDGYMGGGDRIKNSIKKHGKEVHLKEILEYLPDRTSLASKEKEIVNKNLLKDPLCMNLVIGGEGGFGFVNEMHALKFHKAGAKVTNNNYWKNNINRKRQSEKFKTDKEYRENFCKKVKDALKGISVWNGRKHKDDSKLRIGKANSISQKGEKNSQFGSKWINNSISDKKIKSIEFDMYITNGWKPGRIKKII